MRSFVERVSLVGALVGLVCQGIVPEDMPILTEKDLRKMRDESKEKQKEMLEGLELEYTNVVKLEPDTYRDYLGNNSKVLVEYYAPWCGHCKALAPIYETLANETLARGSPIKITKLDATAEGVFDFLDGLQMQGYPHLVLWEDGDIRKIYEGEKTLEALTEFVKLGESPSVFTRTMDEFKTLISFDAAADNKDGQLSSEQLTKVTNEFNEGKESELEYIIVSFNTRSGENSLSKQEKRFNKLAINTGSISKAFVSVIVSSEEAQSSEIIDNLFGIVSQKLSLNSKTKKSDLRRGIYIIRVKNGLVDEDGPNVVGFNLVTKKRAKFKDVSKEFNSQWYTYSWTNFVDCDNTKIVLEEPEEWDPLRVEPEQKNCGLLFDVVPKDRTDVVMFKVKNDDIFVNGKFAELKKSLAGLAKDLRYNYNTDSNGGIVDNKGVQRNVVFGFARASKAGESGSDALNSDVIELTLNRAEIIENRPLHKMDSDMTMLLEESTHKLLEIPHLFKMEINLSSDKDYKQITESVKSFIDQAYEYDTDCNVATMIREKVLGEGDGKVVEWYPSLALGNANFSDPVLPTFDRTEYENSDIKKLKDLALKSNDLTMLSDSKDLITMYSEDFDLIALDPSVDTVVLYVNHDYNKKCKNCESFMESFRRVRRYIMSEYTNQEIMRSIIFTVYNQELEFSREIRGQLPFVVLYPKGTTQVEDGLHINYGPREFSVKTKKDDLSNFILFMEEFTGTLQPDRYKKLGDGKDSKKKGDKSAKKTEL